MQVRYTDAAALSQFVATDYDFYYKIAAQCHNLNRRIMRGSYNPETAWKCFSGIARSGAKRYNRRFPYATRDFSRQSIELAAREIARIYERRYQKYGLQIDGKSSKG